MQRAGRGSGSRHAPSFPRRAGELARRRLSAERGGEGPDRGFPRWPQTLRGSRRPGEEVHAAPASPRRLRVAYVTTVDLTLRFVLLDHLRRVREEGFEVSAVSAPGPWVSELVREGIHHIAWPHATRAWNPLADLRGLIELVRIFRRERFDLVHTHTPKGGFLGRIAAWVAGVPVIVNTVHGLYAAPHDPRAKRTAVATLEWIASRFSDREIYVSQEDLARARRAGVAGRQRSERLAVGIDLTAYDPTAVPSDRVEALREELKIPSGAFVVGTVARLSAEKGYRELFEAARRVGERTQEVRFLVVGDGAAETRNPLREEDLRAAPGEVIFLGWRNDVRDLLALMDVFVLPSRREGLPMAAIQAAAMARPLILSDIPGCREVVRHGVEGLLVPSRDPIRLADAVLRLADDRHLRERLGAMARRRALDAFDVRSSTDRLIMLYRELLTGPRPPTSSANEVVIRVATRSDAAAIARLHRLSLSGAFLPTLGEPFLRVLYRALTTDPNSVALVAEHDNAVVGFAAGTRSVRTFRRRFLARFGVRAAIAAAPRLVRSEVFRRLLEAARYPVAAGTLPDSELLAIAVAPRYRSMGLGRALAEKVVDGLVHLGERSIKVLVGADNVHANRLYERMGFRHATRLALHDGVLSNVWVIECS